MEEEDFEVFVDAINDRYALTSPMPPPSTPHMIGRVTPSLEHGAHTYSEFRECGGTYPCKWDQLITKQGGERL